MFWRKKKFDPKVEAQKPREKIVGRSIERYLHSRWIKAIKRQILVTLKIWGVSLRGYQLKSHIADEEDGGSRAFCCIQYDDFKEALDALIAKGLVTSEPMPDTREAGNKITLVRQKKWRSALFAA